MVNEWHYVTLGDVCRRITKGTTPTTIGGRFTESGIAFIKVESIDDEGQFDDENFAFIDEETNQLLQRSVLQEDDILFTIAGTIGRVAQVTPTILPANTNQAVAILRPKRDFIEPRYLYYALRDKDRVRQANTRVVQSVQANFSLGELANLPLHLPPLAEQRVIVKILGTLDEKINLSRRMNGTLGAMAGAIFRSWFVDFAPVRAKAEGRQPFGMDAETATLFPDSFQDSPLGKIPKGWVVSKLSDLAEQITKGTTPTQDDISNALPSDPEVTFLRVNAITDSGSILYDKLTKIPDSIHKGPLKRSILRVDDVLYTIAGTIGRVAVVEDDILPANTNQAVAIIRPKPEIPPGLLVLTVHQQAFQEELHRNVVQAVQANLSLGMISRASAVFPPMEFLAKIFGPIELILQKVKANRAESRTLAAIRDTLLPKLISGEIRERDAKQKVERAV